MRGSLLRYSSGRQQPIKAKTAARAAFTRAPPAPLFCRPRFQVLRNLGQSDQRVRLSQQ